MKIIKNTPKIVFSILIAFSSTVNAQDELLFPLYENTVIKKAIADHESTGVVWKSTTAPGDTLFLPFFDDFSKATVWPSADRWIDSTAFVNYNFPLNPPTIGVASFDGIDKFGNAYNNTNAAAIGLCDVMTSRVLNLFSDNNGLPYNSSDSIFLVFYYQRKGRGDNTESTDSLVLHFYNPVTQAWDYIWKQPGGGTGDTDFTKVKISINNPDYRQNGFQFRFRSYGAQTGNLDLWHVDYIYLNKFLPPEFENVRDYAYVYPGTSLLNSFSAVPWKHYKSLPTAQQQSMVRADADLTVRNNNDPFPFPIKISGTIYDQYNVPTPIIGGGGLNSISIPLNSNVPLAAALNTNTFFQDPAADEQTLFRAVYDMGQTAGAPPDDFSVNDTLEYIQNFHDYYAYDDGTAELAYGVSGAGAMLAYKFTTLQSDILRAVNIHFTQSGLNVTNQLFKLCIWTGTSAGPVGAPLYEKFNQSPNYTDSINGFYTYHTDSLFMPAGTWFFGFIQNSATILNLGLDVNTPADNTKKFVNTTGSWVNSSQIGMWMIRPVFDSNPLYTGTETTDDLNRLNVYPVPSTDIINLELNVPGYENYSISINDIAGRQVIAFNKFVRTIDVNDLSNGLYFLTLNDPLTGKSVTRKIQVAR